MFKLKGKYGVDRRTLKCDYIRYSFAETLTIYTPRSQIYVSTHRQYSVDCLLNRYLDIIFEVIKTADNSRFGNGKDIKLINLGPNVLFSNFILSTSSGKQLEEINHAHIVSLVYKLITSARDTDGLSIGFERDRNRRRSELTIKKT